MHARIVAVTGVVAALLFGCSQDNPGPSLTISPSGDGAAVAATGPTEFTAELKNASGEVTWMLSGGGALSATTGFHVIYTPPIGTATATLTASAVGLTASVQIAAAPAAIKIPNLTAEVTVQYDAQDIPHIKCAAAIDCLAVQGYIQARDRFFPMDFLRHVARAHLAELIGLDGLAQDVQIRTLFVTRAGHRLEDDLVAALDPATAARLAAFAGGINAYIAELRAGRAALPGEYDQLPFRITGADIADWSAQDSLAMGRLQQFQLSETIEEESAFGLFTLAYGQGPLVDVGKLAAWIRAAAPPSERAHTLSEPAANPAARSARAGRPRIDLSTWKNALAATTAGAHALRAFLRPAAASVGSNNWVVSADKSATGAAMVANDPHLSLQYPPLFHLSVMTSTNAADNLDLAGGTFPGVAGALVGRGAHVGWGVTVVGYDVTDLYTEQFLPQANCPTAAPCVLFKGLPVSTLPVPQTYMVRVATGLVNAQTLGLPAASQPPAAILIVPHHGPIIQTPGTDGKSMSVRWTGQEGNTQDSKAIWGLNTATDVDAAILALKDFATGAQNFVLADDKGHIAYDPHALVPVRSFAVSGGLKPWLPLPGDGSVPAEWGDPTVCATATATPVPATCWISDDALPHGKDPAKGYFFTANSDPTASPSVSDDNDPLSHPPYLSFNWSDSTGFRATRIEQMIDAAIAAHGKVSLEDMQAIQADHVSRPGMLFTQIIAGIPTSDSTPPELAAAKAVLAQWATNGWDCPSGLTGSDPATSAVDTTPVVVQNSSGCFLFHVFLRTLLTNVFTDDLLAAGLSVDGLAALKAMLYMFEPNKLPADQTFCNTRTAAGVTAHTCVEQVATALVQAYDTLVAQVGPTPSSWVWGRVHTIQPVSLLALVTTRFEPGPYARPGGAFTVDVGSPSLSGGGLSFPYRSGGNVRHISVMDPAKPVVKMQLPGPERDGPTGFAGGPDLLGQWVKNSYFDFAFGDQINAANVTVSTESFKAQ